MSSVSIYLYRQLLKKSVVIDKSISKYHIINNSILRNYIPFSYFIHNNSSTNLKDIIRYYFKLNKHISSKSTITDLHTNAFTIVKEVSKLSNNWKSDIYQKLKAEEFIIDYEEDKNDSKKLKSKSKMLPRKQPKYSKKLETVEKVHDEIKEIDITKLGIAKVEKKVKLGKKSRPHKVGKPIIEKATNEKVNSILQFARVSTAKTNLNQILIEDITRLHKPYYKLDARASYDNIKLLYDSKAPFRIDMLKKSIHLLVMSSINAKRDLYLDYEIQHNRLDLAFKLAEILKSRGELSYFLFCDLFIAACLQRNWSLVLYTIANFSNFNGLKNISEFSFNIADFEVSNLKSIDDKPSLYYRFLDRFKALYHSNLSDSDTQIYSTLLEFAVTGSGTPSNRPFELANDILKTLLTNPDFKITPNLIKRSLQVCRLRSSVAMEADLPRLTAVIEFVVELATKSNYLTNDFSTDHLLTYGVKTEIFEELCKTILMAARCYSVRDMPVPTSINQLMESFSLDFPSLSEAENNKLIESDPLLMTEVIEVMNLTKKTDLPSQMEDSFDEESKEADFFEEVDEDEDDYSLEDDMMEIEDYSELDDPLTKNT